MTPPSTNHERVRKAMPRNQLLVLDDARSVAEGRRQTRVPARGMPVRVGPVAAQPHPVRLVVTDDLRRSRLTVFFRLLLAIPHFFWFGLFTVGALFIGFINWWATLFMGRSPKGLHDFLAGYVRYATHLFSYLFLAANPY